MKILGIDYSITSPAMCFGGLGSDFEDLRFFAFTRTMKKAFYPKSFENVTLIEYPEWSSSEERYEKISDILLSGVTDPLTGLKSYDIVAFEGYAYGGSGNVFDIAEATSVMKMKFYRNGNLITTHAPTEIKKYATGKGNANKIAMLDAFIEKTGKLEWKERFGMTKPDKIPSPLSDLVDAYWVWSITHQKCIETKI